MVPSGLALLLTAALVTLGWCDYPCPYDVCQCSYVWINCNNKGLIALPPLKNGTFTQTSLDISGSKITTIREGQLPHGLQVFRSWSTPLVNIEDNAFNGSSSSLNTIDVQYSQLKHLPLELMNLPHITSLTWSDNPMTTWNPSVLAALGNSVETLTLDGINISHIPDWIGYFSELRSFTFRYNNVVKLELSSVISYENRFRSFYHLESINLSSNLIEDTDDMNLLRFSKNLSNIVLVNNNIKSINSLINLDNITHLNIDDNKLSNATEISNALFPHRSSLEYLDLGENTLTRFPDLSYMTILRELWIEFNPISDFSNDSLLPNSLVNLYMAGYDELPLTVSKLTHIEILAIGDNQQMKSIDTFLFPSSLQTLYIGSTGIENISSIVFFQNKTSELNFLDLRNNALLKYIAHDAFIQLTHLKTLLLQGSQLTRLPLALRSLTHLTGLGLDDITTLTCTCKEASLVLPWYNRLTPLIIGDCGGTRVDYFMSHMAQNCPIIDNPLSLRSFNLGLKRSNA